MARGPVPDLKPFRLEIRYRTPSHCHSTNNIIGVTNEIIGVIEVLSLALSCFLVRGPSILMDIYIPVTSKKQATSFAMFVYPGKIVRVRKSSSDY